MDHKQYAEKLLSSPLAAQVSSEHDLHNVSDVDYQPPSSVVAPVCQKCRKEAQDAGNR